MKMKFTKSHNDYRFCSRCLKELSDPSSVESGIGPICNQKSTALFAKTIPVNVPVAYALALVLNTEDIPLFPKHEGKQPREVFETTKAKMLEKLTASMQNVSSANKDGLHITGTNYKEEVKVFDWMCSFEMGLKVKSTIVSIVRSLGYVGLASVLDGKASTGEANIAFVNGYLTLSGSRCKSGYNAFALLKKRGVKVPTWNDKKYYVPAALYQEFINIVLEYWPMFLENMEEVVEQAKEYCKNSTVQVKVLPSIPDGPYASFKTNENKEGFVVSFTWQGNSSYQIVNDLKKINYKNRKFIPSTKEWEFFKGSDREFIEEVFTKNNYSIVNL